MENPCTRSHLRKYMRINQFQWQSLAMEKQASVLPAYYAILCLIRSWYINRSIVERPLGGGRCTTRQCLLRCAYDSRKDD